MSDVSKEEIYQIFQTINFWDDEWTDKATATVNEIIRKRQESAWDHGVREGKRLGEWGLPGLPNPYREKDK